MNKTNKSSCCNIACNNCFDRKCTVNDTNCPCRVNPSTQITASEKK